MKACSAVAATDRGTSTLMRGALPLRFVYFCSVLLMTSSIPAVAASMQETVADCTAIVRDFTRIPEHAIPRRVLRNAKGVAILRVLKGAFGVSGRLGEGVVLARLPGGGWSAPSAIATGGGGFGLQIGGEVTEFVIILNTRAAVDAFARGSNVQFGGALSAAAGPVGRTAEAGLLPAAAVYTYSRSQGLFAGASLEGTIIVAQRDKDTRYYGRSVTPERILHGRVPAPSSARPLINALRRY